MEDPDWRIIRPTELILCQGLVEDKKENVSKLGLESNSSGKMLEMVLERDRGVKKLNRPFCYDSASQKSNSPILKAMNFIDWMD